MVYRCIRFLFWFIFHTCYKLKVYGEKNLPEGRAIIAPNHTSFFDPPLVAAACPEPVHFLSKESLFHKPILSFFLPRLNTHPLSGTGADFASFKIILKLLGEEKKVAIFPEGVRTHTDELGTLKAGVVLLARRADSPIVPVYIDGAFDIWSRHRRFPKPWGRLVCCFGSPIEPEGLSKEELLEQLKEKINALRTWYHAGAEGTPP